MFSQQRSIRILGLGNDLLQDDGVGLEAVRRLGEIFKGSIDCLETSSSGLGLIEYLVDCHKIIIIDAVVSDSKKSGQVFEWSLDGAGGEKAFSPHSLGLREIGKIAYQHSLPFPDRVKVIGISVKDPFTIGGELSPEVDRAIDKVIATVKRIVSLWMKEEEPEEISNV